MCLRPTVGSSYGNECVVNVGCRCGEMLLLGLRSARDSFGDRECVVCVSCVVGELRRRGVASISL